MYKLLTMTPLDTSSSSDVDETGDILGTSLRLKRKMLDNLAS